ncbi:FAD binding domain-containing protein [Acuticoccus sp.]|uniref:FAD binding domain-containing protein n=1 Tax=Acuticoccus sp. TaxID=1904378 RepID=UPI003B52D4AC
MPVTVTTCATLAQAARAAASRTARVIGGGTIVMRAVNDGDTSFDTLIRVTDPAYTQVRATGGAFVIGGGVTMADIVAHRDLAFLAPVARVVGGPQVRSAATIAGNLFAEPPYGDLAGALIALGATVEGADGRRTPVEEPVRRREGFVAAVHVPRPDGELRFTKVSRVRPKGVSVMSIAALVPRGGRGETRIVFNGMGPYPMRAAAAERALAGRPLDPAAVAEAARVAADGLEPRDDALASAWYRREVAGVHLARLLTAR